MSKRCESDVVCLLIAGLAVITGSAVALPRPNPQDQNVPDTSGGLPFLQFTNGGVRVNFGGYHAEAGLGGLLTGNKAGGGLHASAGTPTGAHASAGLGGLLGGDNANAGGGLHARAGLGNGGPESAAGLGGRLDGSGRSGSRAAGGLYANASPGSFGKSLTLADDSTRNSDTNANAIASANANANVNANSNSRSKTNIQIIHRKDKVASKPKEILDSSASSYSDSAVVDLVPPAAGASLFGSIGTDGVLTKVKTVQTSHVEDFGGVEAPSSSSAPPTANTVLYPARWYRKRLRPARKHLLYNTLLTNDTKVVFVPQPPPVKTVVLPSASAGAAIGVGVAADAQANAQTAVGVPYNGHRTGGTFFDDIFNIPISTLNAVNQFLNGKVGK